MIWGNDCEIGMSSPINYFSQHSVLLAGENSLQNKSSLFSAFKLWTEKAIYDLKRTIYGFEVIPAE